MPNDYYERLSEQNPGEIADGLAIEQEFDAISRGFSKLPTPHRDGRGFEGATRVGEPQEKTDAVNLGTLEKLNLPIYRKKITIEDWDSITEPGIYDVTNATGFNAPPSYPYGVLIVNLFNGVATQAYYPDKDGTIVKRVCENITLNSWLDWDFAYSLSMGAPGFRNKIRNGCFRVNQRAYVSGSATSPNQYTLDRWKVSGVAGITFAVVNGKTKITIPPGQTIKQVVEAIELPAGDYVLSWGGTALGRIDNGEFASSGMVSSSLVGGSGVTVEFSSGTLWDVQLEHGKTKTPFELRPYGYELGLCQRYFFSSENAYSLLNYQTPSSQWVSNRVPFPVTMRAIPSVSIWSNGVAGQIQISDAPLYTNNFNVNADCSGVGIVCRVANASFVFPHKIQASAEL
ncbi:pyocin knob domain-containing protein [Aeromonas enteropelogenes]|uniref:pyocin knob domain-containing protein n=1 Tax=Aeromonas enteropelogenes TaxID=29489 RepID=UPI002285C07C|nr:pyocin knob domain-containing protein [Aeromonas enteropelogenes]MCZ0752585.1 pyocin knob domain-containing protein [Aeromonas enteropelogenes]